MKRRAPVLPLKYVSRLLTGLSKRSSARDRWIEIDNDGFIRLAYRTLLGREATERAVNYWNARLRFGDSRRSILQTIRFSHEGRTRRLTEPGLQSLLAFSWLRRLVPVPLLPRDKAGARWRRRRPENGQGAIAADLGGLKSPMSPMPTAIADASDLRPEAARRDLSPFAPVQEIAHLKQTSCAIGVSHTLLVAPGTILDRRAQAWLDDALRGNESDLAIGDEIERGAAGARDRLHRRGPFSHEAFLQMPDLGGAIAAHNALLDRLGLSRTMVLTGAVGLRLVANAHTITHANAVVAVRSADSIKSNQPSFDEMQTFTDRIRHSELAVRDIGFDVRFPVRSDRRIAIILVHMAGTDESQLELSLDRVRELTDMERCVPIVARPTPAGETSYGALANEAIRTAPADCDVVVVLDSGVVPTERGWPQRLAETALFPRVGLVAPRTMYPDGRIRHAGMAFGFGDPCRYVGRLERLDDFRGDAEGIGYSRITGLREVSAVSRHCMAFRRQMFSDIGGFAEDLHRDAVDIDLCLRFRAFGKTAMVDGRVVMEQADMSPRWGRTLPRSEKDRLRMRYPALADADEFYVPAATGAAATPRVRTTYLAPIDNR